MQSVEFSMGPLLIEIERPMNDKLGLILSSYSNLHLSDHNKIDEVSTAGVFIASILLASIADRFVLNLNFFFLNICEFPLIKLKCN